GGNFFLDESILELEKQLRNALLEMQPQAQENQKGFSTGWDLVLVKTQKPWHQKKILNRILYKGNPRDHKGKTYYTSMFTKSDRPAVYFVDDRTFLLASDDKEMHAALERPGKKEVLPGPLARALKLCAKHHLVASYY